jgi:hypothetical protein
MRPELCLTDIDPLSSTTRPLGYSCLIRATKRLELETKLDIRGTCVIVEIVNSK